MSVYRPKGSRFYHYDFWLNARRFRKSTKATTRRAADRIEDADRNLVLESGEGAVEMTIEAAAERYYRDWAQFQPSAKDTDRMADRLIAALGAKRLSEIANHDVATMVAKRRATMIVFKAPKKKKGGKREKARPPRRIASSTVNRETELLRRIMRKAGRSWGVRIAPIDWSEHILPEPQERIRELTADEDRALFKHLRPDLHPMVRFCLLTGARLGSAIRLTWDQVDHTAGALMLRVKGGKLHSIPMPPAVRALVASERGKHPIYVFPYRCVRSRGKRRKGEYYPFSRSGWRKVWMRALKAAGISDFRFHDTRHTAATRVLRASRNLKIVQKMLGHTDIATTARYAHVTLDDISAAMQDAAGSQETPAGQGTTDGKALIRGGKS